MFHIILSLGSYQSPYFLTDKKRLTRSIILFYLKIWILRSKRHLIGFVARLSLWQISMCRVRWDNIDFLTINNRRPSRIDPWPITVYDFYKRNPRKCSKFQSNYVCQWRQLHKFNRLFQSIIPQKEGDIEIMSSNISSERNDIHEWLSMNKLSLIIKKTHVLPSPSTQYY